ncbi:hypothetical protein CMT41_17690 [Colwellia sp. MT41]|uniref:anti-sigma factor n=1 Tax=Colwellia sp. MT41 TaxID=58049 RepID=UPI000717A213|nr:anti-sigma factor [Colwellia sp. MT41]ALO36366.1 hypothetical protein CMT41_17690 [Colwellia sp. MT41]
MPKKLAPKQLTRYTKPTIVEHIASHYVLGTLSTLVHNRAEQLMLVHPQLEAIINHWQQSFIALDRQTTELAPKESTWQAITAQVDNLTTTEANNNLGQAAVKAQPAKQKHARQELVALIKPWFTLASSRFIHAVSIVVICLLSFALLNSNRQGGTEDSLSYIAVLTNPDNNAQFVASTYGESKTLVINIIHTPDISAAEDLELWVVSKTDQQARSLGIIPRNVAILAQQLTVAQWRLIKDSASLIVTIEDLGGSPIGEPSDIIVARGLCIRLKEWQKNA